MVMAESSHPDKAEGREMWPVYTIAARISLPPFSVSRWLRPLK
jgi:hypothetical protein